MRGAAGLSLGSNCFQTDSRTLHSQEALNKWADTILLLYLLACAEFGWLRRVRVAAELGWL